MRKFAIAITITFILTSCRKTDKLSETQKLEITKEVKATLGNYYNDIRKSGLTAEFKYLDSSSDFFWVPPGYTSYITYDSVIIAIKQNALHYKLVDSKFEQLKINPLNLELASYTGKINTKMIDTAGNSIKISLVETGVLIKRNDTWKLLSGQTSIIN